MRYKWAIVLACAVGLVTSISPIFYSTLPVFLRAIGADTGWGRAQIISAASVGTCVAIISSPLLGRLVDMLGPRRVIMLAAVPFGLSIMGLKYVGSSYIMYLALAASIGFFGNCAGLFVYLSFIPRWFDRHLGLGLGFAATGIGIGQTLAPLFASYLLQSVGWRDSYVVLGLIAMAVTLACSTLILRDQPSRFAIAPIGPAVVVDGLTMREALRTPEFWRLAASFLLVTAAVTGCVLNLVPMLIDRGVAPNVAAGHAAFVGLSVLLGRLSTGILLDFVSAWLIAAVAFAAPALAILLLLVGHSTEMLYVVVPLLGLSLGAEGDIMAYMVRRAFGMRAYSQIYGCFWTTFSAGFLIGPIIMGASFDLLGTYQPVLIGLGVCAAAAVIFVPNIEDVQRIYRTDDLHQIPKPLPRICTTR